MATDSAATGADRWDRATPLSLVIVEPPPERTAERWGRAGVLPACATRIEVKFVETALSSN